MKKKTSLAIVQTIERRTPEERQKYREEDDRWEEAEKSWLITAYDAQQRVLALRNELERYQAQLESAAFDIASGDSCSPNSVEWGERQHSLDLAMKLNPFVDRMFEEIDDYAHKHGPALYFIDFQSKLFDLRTQSIETGFKIGVLAGVIFSGASKEVVDRFERGLAYDMKFNKRVVKK